MSRVLINQYYQNVERTLKYGKSHNEQSIRHHFLNLLNEYARKQNYDVIPELAIMGTRGKKVYPDGTVKSSIAKGYPLDNILEHNNTTPTGYQIPTW